MLLLNFAHPLIEGHLKQIEELTRQTVERVIEINSQIDPRQPLLPQVADLAGQAGLTAGDWQTRPLLINPPTLNFVAVALLAELHGRCGYFPACVRLRLLAEKVPPGYEVAEVINLQAVREAARTNR